MPPLLSTTLGRLRRIARLDAEAFDDVRFDTSATIPAIVIAVAGLFALGLGGWLWWRIAGLGELGAVFVKTVILGTVFGFGGWLLWLLVIYSVLRQVSGITVQVEQLLRTAGFAAGVLVIALGMAVTPVAFGVGLLALAAWFGATQLAVERTVGRGGGDVLAANLAGFGAWVIVMSLLSTDTNQIGPGPFLAEAVWNTVQNALVVGQ